MPKTVARRSTRPTRKRRLPYLKKIEQRGRMAVWRVDGSYIRTNRDEEFSNFGHHHTFSFIPKNEIWIDEADPDEEPFFVEHCLVEYRLMKQGMSADEALQAADKVEAQKRAHSGDVKKMTRGHQLPDPQQVHLRLWKKLETPVWVWVVNGRLVRSVFDIDFTEGGHEHVYEFIPHGEVWIDNDVTDVEKPYVLLHELHERNLMEKGWDYDRAHEHSSKLEVRCRKHPNKLHEALAAEGWE
jgi:hypothetical protein